MNNFKLPWSKDEIVQINSIQFLQTMTYGDELITKMVVSGGICALFQVVEPRSTCSPNMREITLRLIENLCFLQ